MDSKGGSVLLGGWLHVVPMPSHSVVVAGSIYGKGGGDVVMRPSNCVAAVASWNCLYLLLEQLTEDRWTPVLIVYLPESKVQVRGVSVVTHIWISCGGSWAFFCGGGHEAMLVGAFDSQHLDGDPYFVKLCLPICLGLYTRHGQ